MSETISSYRDLIVWQQATELADFVYTITEKFPPREHFGLSAQMRKAAVSIPSNIAEGTRHRTAGYLARVIIALGEHAEVETQAIIAARRKFISAEQMRTFEQLTESVGQLAHGLARSLEVRIAASQV
jgi:four helix bundle protein